MLKDKKTFVPIKSAVRTANNHLYSGIKRSGSTVNFCDVKIDGNLNSSFSSPVGLNLNTKIGDVYTNKNIGVVNYTDVKGNNVSQNRGEDFLNISAISNSKYNCERDEDNCSNYNDINNISSINNFSNIEINEDHNKKAKNTKVKKETKKIVKKAVKDKSKNKENEPPNVNFAENQNDFNQIDEIDVTVYSKDEGKWKRSNAEFSSIGNRVIEDGVSKPLRRRKKLNENEVTPHVQVLKSCLMVLIKLIVHDFCFVEFICLPSCIISLKFLS